MLPRSHNLMGAVLVLAIPNPFISLPLSFVSHLAMDKFCSRSKNIHFYGYELLVFIILFVTSYLTKNWVIMLSLIFSSFPDAMDAIVFKKRVFHYPFKNRIGISGKNEIIFDIALIVVIIFLVRCIR
jgi:hypothetical protein